MRRVLGVMCAILLPHRVAAADWVAATATPTSASPADAKDKPVVAACGGGIDAALVTVATSLANDLATKGELPDAQEIEWRQRKAGDPHVWPKTWGARGTLDRTLLAKQVSAWLGASAPRMRCGVASAWVGDKEAIAVIAIDPVAELMPIPTHTKVGAWIDLDAKLREGATEGRVVVLPPVGAPKTVLSSTTGKNHVKARFSLAKPGRWVVQVLADVGNGPRPVLEAEIFAGVDPPEVPPSNAVPGEDAGDAVADPEAALFARLNGARAAEGLPALTQDKTLLKVARAHAEAMKKAHLLGHDVGDGDPATRVVEAGAAFKLVGENVAKAKAERTAHRALYASPSHRANLLDTRFKKVGIAVVVDAKTGDLWVAQLFGG
ncbi:MAG: CAP domain-containing protein [Polyangiales bacterium]